MDLPEFKKPETAELNAKFEAFLAALDDFRMEADMSVETRALFENDVRFALHGFMDHLVKAMMRADAGI